MTEAAIIKLGFKKEDISAEESGGIAYYYYTYGVGKVTFISISNDLVEDDIWYVEILEGGVKFVKSVELKIVILLMEANKG
jgi:hypothetical protein